MRPSPPPNRLVADRLDRSNGATRACGNETIELVRLTVASAVLGSFAMTGGTATRREAIVNQLLLFILLLALPLAFASFGRVFHDGDTSWHLAVGRWMVEHGRIPDADVFSYTAYGKPWVAMEWLSDLVFTGAFAAAGYAGVAAVVAAALIALSWIVFLHLHRRVGPIGIAVTILAMDVVLATFML